VTTIDLATLCHWTQGRGDAQEVTHAAFHYGSPCPYEVMAAVMLGLPDPRDAVAEWRIDLPFAGGKPPLSLNDRLHWAAHAARVEKIKAITRNAVREAGVPQLGHVHVVLHYRPAINRFRDIDNFIATQKVAVDALHQPDERSRWEPIVAGDDARYVSWSPPVLHPAIKGIPAATWLILTSYEGPTE
jgi:crossover junction endodeoxyribonuclease RusA